MSILSSLTRPRLPRACFVLEANEAAAVELRKRGNRFALAAAARSPLPEGLLTPQFSGRNIASLDELAGAVYATVESAGLSRRQRWSVLVPEDSVKSLLVSFDSVPTSREEMHEMVNWKVERMMGVPAADLRITRQFVGAGSVPHVLAVAIRREVVAEYEALLDLLGWRAGLVVPRYFGEAAWFDWDATPGDKLLVGSRGDTCLAAFVRSGELIFVRSLDGNPQRLEDEIYRLLLYYRERIVSSPESAAVTGVLASGPIDGERISATIAEALGTAPAIVRPVPDLLDSEAPDDLDAALLAAAGLATQAWVRA